MNSDESLIDGFCDERFLSVRAAFEENFREGLELGASLAIEIDGFPKVDLWGGYSDLTQSKRWREDTVCIVFSNTKPATALCAHRLAELGALDLDRSVSYYWPAFGGGERRTMTARMFLDHSAGLPALREVLPEGAAFDWDYMVHRLERESPFWEPGSRVGYHGLTYGWLVGELVRRISGESLGTFWRKEIAEPLGLDFWIGLPEEKEDNVAAIAPAQSSAFLRNPFEKAIQEEPDSISTKYFANTGGWRPTGFNSRQGHAAELGATNGITNARSLARLYGTLSMGGSRDSFTILGQQTLNKAVRVSSATHLDACLRVPTRFASGFMREVDNHGSKCESLLIGADAFGHSGAGGSLAFASPRHRIGFAYTMNQMGPGVFINERAQRLVSATYQAIEAL